jgi:hypothetical protein
MGRHSVHGRLGPGVGADAHGLLQQQHHAPAATGVGGARGAGPAAAAGQLPLQLQEQRALKGLVLQAQHVLVQGEQGSGAGAGALEDDTLALCWAFVQREAHTC